MNTKSEIRSQLNNDIEKFMNNGGFVTIIKPRKSSKIKMSVTGKQKKFFGWSEPSKHISVMWDSISTK